MFDAYCTYLSSMSRDPHTLAAYGGDIMSHFMCLTYTEFADLHTSAPRRGCVKTDAAGAGTGAVGGAAVAHTRERALKRQRVVRAVMDEVGTEVTRLLATAIKRHEDAEKDD